MRSTWRQQCLLLTVGLSTALGFSSTAPFSHSYLVPLHPKPFRNVNTRLTSQHDAAPETFQTESQSTLNEQNFTVTFPPLLELQHVRRGDFLASDPIQVQEHEFRVLLYPRGGGHSSSSTAVNGKRDGPFSKQDAASDRVGVYLQYLPQSKEATVDATFNLRLKGQQSKGPRFDVDWTTGMRFVAADKGNLRDGTANDFGAHFMNANLLEDFLGGEDSQEQLDIEVKVKVYPRTNAQVSPIEGDSSPFSFEDIRNTEDPTKHNTEKVRVGKVVVPVLKSLSQRPRLFELGAYPGVEYRVMRIVDPKTGEDVFTSMPGADYELKPIYPLVQQLERQWPVRVNEKELPKLYTENMYNVISALGSLFTAASALTTAFIISQLISFFFIPSKSMDPTLKVGDVLLVEKVTPRVLKNPNVGDVVLFNPNNKLQDIVKANGGKISDRDLFVKRVAAGPGDKVSVDSTGSVVVNGAPVSGKRDLCEEEPLRLIQRYVQPIDNLEIKQDEVFVLGDCSSVSVDSRVWGPLSKEEIVGRPLVRIWPFESMGSVPAIPSSATSKEIIERGTMATDWSDQQHEARET